MIMLMIGVDDGDKDNMIIMMIMMKLINPRNVVNITNWR